MKKKRNKKAMVYSFMIHSVLICAGIIPLISMVRNEDEAEGATYSFIEIAFEDGDMSPSNASTKPVKIEKPEIERVKPELEKEEVTVREESKTVENELIEPDEKAEINMEKGKTKDDVKEESLAKVNEAGDESAVEGSSDSESEAGEGETGEEITGLALANMDFEGEGVFGRKIIYHANISKLAEKEGRVVVNLCINRSGNVTHIAFNREASSLTDTGYVREVMSVASKYRFEADYTAPRTQCGKLTFIFKFK